MPPSSQKQKHKLNKNLYNSLTSGTKKTHCISKQKGEEGGNLKSLYNPHLCKCHTTFIHKCTGHTVYTRPWVWDQAHILLWYINKKAMPCVSGRESQSPGSLLQVNSPENVRTIYTEYTV